MHSETWVLALAICAIIFIAFGIGFVWYGNIFNNGAEEVEARITSIKKSSAGDPIYYVYAEYYVDGQRIRGRHFSSLVREMMNFSEGDTVTVTVNPKHPKIFCVTENGTSHLKRNGLLSTGFGCISGILAIAAYVVTR